MLKRDDGGNMNVQECDKNRFTIVVLQCSFHQFKISFSTLGPVVLTIFW